LVAATEAIRCPIMEQQFTGVPPEGPPPEREIAAPRNGQRIKMKPTLAAAFCLPLHYVPLRDNRGATHPKKRRTGPCLRGTWSHVPVAP